MSDLEFPFLSDCPFLPLEIFESISLYDFEVCKTMFLSIPNLGRKLFNKKYSNNLLERFIARTNSIDEELTKKLGIILRPCFASYLPNYRLHSINDEPAAIYPNGTLYWYFNGKLHRGNDQPAIIFSDGTQYWYLNGKVHRGNDKPAVIYHNRIQCWYLENKLHRDNDKPVIIYPDGTQEWYSNGKLQKTTT